MDRLTERCVIRHKDGTEYINTYCHGHRYGQAAFPSKYGTSEPQEYKDYCEMVDRLAEYEDTGLTPADINQLQRKIKAITPKNPPIAVDDEWRNEDCWDALYKEKRG